jgi:hypothetical protein
VRTFLLEHGFDVSTRDDAPDPWTRNYVYGVAVCRERDGAPTVAGHVRAGHPHEVPRGSSYASSLFRTM